MCVSIVLCSHIIEEHTPAFIDKDKFPAMRDVYDYPILSVQECYHPRVCEGENHSSTGIWCPI